MVHGVLHSLIKSHDFYTEPNLLQLSFKTKLLDMFPFGFLLHPTLNKFHSLISPVFHLSDAILSYFVMLDSI